MLYLRMSFHVLSLVLKVELIRDARKSFTFHENAPDTRQK
jgi:hypothetical protein